MAPWLWYNDFKSAKNKPAVRKRRKKICFVEIWRCKNEEQLKVGGMYAVLGGALELLGD